MNDLLRYTADIVPTVADMLAALPGAIPILNIFILLSGSHIVKAYSKFDLTNSIYNNYTLRNTNLFSATGAQWHLVDRQYKINLIIE